MWEDKAPHKWLKQELKKTYRYYYEHLSDNYKIYYRKIFHAMLSLETTVKLPLIDISACDQIYKQCICDNPLFFFVDSAVFSICPFEMIININYSMEEKEILDALRKIKSILRNVKLDCELYNEIEKEEYIHRFIIKNVHYELDDLLPVHYAHSVFLYKKAVCDGISKAAKILMDSIGLRSIVLLGKSLHSNIMTTDSMHAWNMVWIEDQPYHMDFTFDNTLSNQVKYIRHDYFNLSDEQIRKDHSYDNIDIHANITYDWFRMKHLYFEKKNEVRRHINSQVKNKSKLIYFRIPYTNNPDKTIKEMQKLILDEIKNSMVNSFSFDFTVNKEQMVIYLFFRDG